MSHKRAKKFRQQMKKLWDKQFTESINKMNFRQRFNLAWRIIRKDFRDATHTKI